MILESSGDLGLFVKSLYSECRDSYEVVEMSILEECFARSQGFGTMDELIDSLPILLDCTNDASRKFIDLFLQGNSYQEQKAYIFSDILKTIC